MGICWRSGRRRGEEKRLRKTPELDESGGLKFDSYHRYIHDSRLVDGLLRGA
jgi:hypothetical protein